MSDTKVVAVVTDAAEDYELRLAKVEKPKTVPRDHGRQLEADQTGRDAQPDGTLSQSPIEEWRSTWSTIRNRYREGQEGTALAEFERLDAAIEKFLKSRTHPEDEQERVHSELPAFLTDVYRSNCEFGRVVFRWRFHHGLLRDD